ncbi:DNA alkylation repair protein [Dyadobacter sp. Leaf189]|uniref:DNA alkylation repair protein n=1 Tax=Dyadobacter sp. Leaf189 TaxID=1736295 RepID=UPI000700CF39|nr:DNA alkylation repair protein [Dyadobacter sp. Leaf189]KQS26574.1 DNA alkylation repair enzyme [Dyadobacter sp. Leaf189]
MLEEIINELQKTEHGFKHIEEAGKNILEDKQSDILPIALELLGNETYQARMLGTFLLGQLAAENEQALQALKSIVATDPNWRVQEMLAKAFDYYCSRIGYEASLAEIKTWLLHENPNLNRAAVEGLRIWTSRPYFKEHPQIAIGLIAQLKGSESEYVRKSVGNALRDISKKHGALVAQELLHWDLTDKRVAYTQKLVTKNQKLGRSA